MCPLKCLQAVSTSVVPMIQLDLPQGHHDTGNDSVPMTAGSQGEPTTNLFQNFAYVFPETSQLLDQVRVHVPESQNKGTHATLNEGSFEAQDEGVHTAKWGVWPILGSALDIINVLQRTLSHKFTLYKEQNLV